jgi:hypothetical protein
MIMDVSCNRTKERAKERELGKWANSRRETSGATETSRLTEEENLI